MSSERANAGFRYYKAWTPLAGGRIKKNARLLKAGTPLKTSELTKLLEEFTSVDLITEAKYQQIVREQKGIEQVWHRGARPKKKDKVEVMTGELKGCYATLIGIDVDDGIINMQANSDIKIIPMDNLATISEEVFCGLSA